MTEHDLVEMRAKAAEKMGWTQLRYNRNGVLVGHGLGRRDFQPVPHYGQKLEDTWALVDKLHKEGMVIHISTFSNAPVALFEVRMGRVKKWLGTSINRNISMALIQAFLKI